jgi:hypothetical protein
MQESLVNLTRRETLGALALLSGTSLLGAAHAQAGNPRAGDFDFLMGSWRVKHRTLKARLAGERTWLEFTGTCRAWPLQEGNANIDDNVLEAPAGSYRGLTLRRYDANSGKWWIWWIDDHISEFTPPVIGEFKDGVGTFYGDDEWQGRPIKVRFIWSQIFAQRARWEQAFSLNQGASWEVNWIMQFEREA